MIEVLEESQFAAESGDRLGIHRGGLAQHLHRNQLAGLAVGGPEHLGEPAIADRLRLQQEPPTKCPGPHVGRGPAGPCLAQPRTIPPDHVVEVPDRPLGDLAHRVRKVVALPQRGDALRAHAQRLGHFGQPTEPHVASLKYLSLAQV